MRPDSFALPDLDAPTPITFAPNMTEATFQNQDDHDAFDPDPCPSFPESDSNDTDDNLWRAANTKKKNKDHIPRPPNAFILFRSHFIKQQVIPGSIEGNHSQLSKIVGAYWQRLGYEEKQVWEKRAKVARAEHKRKYPDYRFVRSRNPKSTPKEKLPPKFVNTIPINSAFAGVGPASGVTTLITTTQSPTKSPRKRNVSNKTAEDPHRCEQIARLLVAGHKGSSLEAMVQQLDAQSAQARQEKEAEQIPEGQVTKRARHIRRSSSCPPLEIPSTPVFSLDGPKSAQAPSRRQKPLKSHATMPYPPTFTKQSRSVSPPNVGSCDALFRPTSEMTLIHGPFAQSTFTFVPTPVSPITAVPEAIAPHDTRFVYSPTAAHSFNWPVEPTPSPVQKRGAFTAFSHSQMVPLTLSASSSSSDLAGIATPDFWTSDFDWITTEDEGMTCAHPPPTPDTSSPSTPFSRLLPVDNVTTLGSYPDAEQIHTTIEDLSSYAKGLLHLMPTQPDTFGVDHLLSPTTEVDMYGPASSTFGPAPPGDFQDAMLWNGQQYAF